MSKECEININIHLFVLDIEKTKDSQCPQDNKDDPWEQEEILLCKGASSKSPKWEYYSEDLQDLEKLWKGRSSMKPMPIYSQQLIMDTRTCNCAKIKIITTKNILLQTSKRKRCEMEQNILREAHDDNTEIS